MHPTLKNQLTKTFYQLLADIQTPEEAEIFLEDFLSAEELEVFAKRLAISYWLKKGRDKENIIQNLDTTEMEINKTKELLETPGIQLALKKIEAEEFANVWSEKINDFIGKNKV
jgi:uncharacterized protein YerC